MIIMYQKTKKQKQKTKKKGLKAAFSHKALHRIQFYNEVLDECENNSG